MQWNFNKAVVLVCHVKQCRMRDRNGPKISLTLMIFSLPEILMAWNWVLKKSPIFVQNNRIKIVKVEHKIDGWFKVQPLIYRIWKEMTLKILPFFGKKANDQSLRYKRVECVMIQKLFCHPEIGDSGYGEPSTRHSQKTS